MRLPYDPNTLGFITSVTHLRRPIFCDARLAERLGTMIRLGCPLKGFRPVVYAILPDHFHLLVCSEFLLGRTLEMVRPSRSIVASESFVFPEIPEKLTDSVLFSLLSSRGISEPPDPKLGALMQAIKGTFSRTLPPGKVWKKRYHCFMISDSRDAARVINYIIYNYRHSGVPDFFGQEPFVWRDDTLIGELLS